QTQAHFSALAVAKTILSAILLPLAAGMALGCLLRIPVPRVARLIGAAGTILLLVASLPLLVLALQALQILTGTELWSLWPSLSLRGLLPAMPWVDRTKVIARHSRWLRRLDIRGLLSPLRVRIFQTKGSWWPER